MNKQNENFTTQRPAVCFGLAEFLFSGVRLNGLQHKFGFTSSLQVLKPATSTHTSNVYKLLLQHRRIEKSFQNTTSFEYMLILLVIIICNDVIP
jgi:hypothetical protein